jgi:uracil-DNA glycosylase family 4
MPQFNVHGLDDSPNCAGCPCAKNGQPVRPVRGFGGTGGLCIVAEGPGTKELEQGFPLIGPSGGIVNRAFRQAGIDRGHVFLVNALLCKRPSGDAELDVAVDHCRARLAADLAMAEPTAICALGGTAMRALQLPVSFVSQARGTVQLSPLAPDVPVIGALHPAALLHGGAGEMTSGGKQKMNVDAQAIFLYADIAKAHAVSQGLVDPVWSDDIRVVHNPAEVHEALEALLVDVYDWGMLGIDLEWICEGHKNALDALGANAHMAQITWVGLGCEKRSVSFKWEALLEADAFPRLQQIMEDENLPKLAHNKQADRAIWEAQVGPIKGRFWDSMLMHHAVCPGIDHDLQQVVSQYLCVPPWKVEHQRQIAEHEEKLKAEAKVAKAAEKEAVKADKKAKHEAANAQKKAEAEARKAQRMAEHVAKNASAKAEKKARKRKGKGEDVLPEQMELPNVEG